MADLGLCGEEDGTDDFSGLYVSDGAEDAGSADEPAAGYTGDASQTESCANLSFPPGTVLSVELPSHVSDASTGAILAGALQEERREDGLRVSTPDNGLAVRGTCLSLLAL